MTGAPKGKLGVGRDGRAGERLSVIVHVGQRAELEAAAKASERSVSWLVRQAVTRYLREVTR